MPPIKFQATPYAIGSWTVLRLPPAASKKLPSRGMSMVAGTINGSPFQAPLEPDGKGSHWLKIEKGMKAKAGATARLEIAPMEQWPEPMIPADLKQALAAAPESLKVWNETTPLARWDWIRWVGMSKNPDTRKKHIVVALSKLAHGERRPCCFNRSVCCEPAVSKQGVLLDPAN
jgi:Bacteriocin-protection, YdeI or OmpD-Associated/Domain of unknown function (DUF1905)